MPKPSDDSKYRIEEDYYAPFGRYEADRRAPHPANEVLIGRQAQRAKFLNRLLTSGRRGAYLITGHRGSGKTSFVRYCLGEYEENVYVRYLQRNIGRAFFWNQFGLLVIGAVLVTTGVILSQALSHLLLGHEQSLLIVLLEIVLAVLLSFPLFVALRTIRGAFRANGGGKNSFKRLALFLFSLSLGLFFLLSAHPSQVVLQLIIFISHLILGAYLFSWQHEPYDRSNEGLVDSPVESISQWFKPPPLGEWEGSKTLYVWTKSLISRWGEPSYRRKWSFTLWILVLVAWSVTAGLWRKTDDLKTEILFCVVPLVLALIIRARADYRHRSTYKKPLKGVLLSGALKYVVAALVVIISVVLLRGLRLPEDRTAYVWLSVISATLIVARILFLKSVRHTEKPARFAPRPRYLLAFKAVALVVLGVQLLAPALFVVFAVSEPASSAIKELDISDESVVAIWTSSGAVSKAISPDVLWVVLTVILLALIHFLEYEWIVRPASRTREDLYLSDRQPRTEDRLSEERHDFRHMFHATFFYTVYKHWLPVLIIPVNLGFDRLDQRMVIEAMLVGLRQQFRRVFRSWKSPVVTTVRLLSFMVLLLLALSLGNRWFHPPSGVDENNPCFDLYVQRPQERAAAEERAVALQSAIAGEPSFLWQVGMLAHDMVLEQRAVALAEGPLPLRLVCHYGGNTAYRFLQWSPLGTPTEKDDDSVVREMLDVRVTFAENWITTDSEGSRPLFSIISAGGLRRIEEIEFRLYHLLVFAFLLFTWNIMGRWWQPLPYRDIDVRIGSVLDGLSSRLREEDRPNRLTAFLNAVRGRDTIRAKEGGPFDPRTVELHFLAILEELHNPQIQVPFTSGTGRINLPLPEVIFLFDELDKIEAISSVGGSVPAVPPDTTPGAEQVQPLDRERARSRALHGLFADLKNVISSGQARFVFIGGRNLHDEWLADATARRPLLTNIFTTEIYIPSLLTDRVGLLPEDVDLDGPVPGIEAFLQRQYFRAQALYESSLLRRLRPGFSLPMEELHSPSFVQEIYDSKKLKRSWRPVSFLSRTQPDLPKDAKDAFQTALLDFLAYRSQGNIKRFLEILADLVEPAGRVILLWDDKTRLIEQRKCDHALLFEDIDRYRIYLLSELFASLLPEIQTRIQMSDDKMPQATLYLADFLLKFHRRAFSWANIERVDELVHIHRAPDLRHTMRKILNRWQDKYIHPIRSGMYDFRFTSEFSHELGYLSRASESELAALNFTLDESHFLKLVYQSRCSVYEDGASEDFISALAELHKFDGEYEIARYYLRRAITVLDSEFEGDVGGSPFENTTLQEVLTEAREPLRDVRVRLTYAIARLRLMLQLGMTYELARDHERALVAYRDARTLARSMMVAMKRTLSRRNDGVKTSNSAVLDMFGRLLGQSANTNRQSLPEANAGDGYVATLKHLHILFQPLFAEAWLTEKVVSAVDVGPAIAEIGLWRMRDFFPFVDPEIFHKDPSTEIEGDRLKIGHANFALLFAELENKLGDLYFFKGRQTVPIEVLERWCDQGAEGKSHHGAEGYLVISNYHYALSLHEIRRYNSYRLATSEKKFDFPQGIERNREETVPIIEFSRSWPDFVARAIAGSLSDLTDCLLARFSFTQLLAEYRDAEVPPEHGEETAEEQKLRLKDARKRAFEHVNYWLQTSTGSLLQEEDGEVDAWLPKTLEPWTFERDKAEWTKFIKESFPTCPGSLSTNLQDWFGVPLPSHIRSRGELIGTDIINSSSERLTTCLLLTSTAAEVHKRAGHTAAAVRQHLRIIEGVSAILWWWRTLHFIHDTLTKERDETPEELREIEPLVELYCAERSQVDVFLDDLARFAIFSLHQVNHLTLPEVDGGRQRLRDGRLPPLSPVLGISLALASPSTVESCAQAVTPLIEGDLRLSFTEALGDALRGALGDTLPGTLENTLRNALRNTLREALEKRLRDFPYPVLGRLYGLKILIDDALLNRPENEKGVPDKVRHWKRTLDTLDQKYASPLHFTSLSMGLTQAIYALSLLENDEERGRQLRLAREHLLKSQRSHTLKTDFYENFSNLYYLYDDFNDSAIHFQHALQMAGSEVASLAIRCIGLELGELEGL